ncbi:MAG: hypothetical protein Q9205_006347, partial [Flavoplaca limonia]
APQASSSEPINTTSANVPQPSTRKATNNTTIPIASPTTPTPKQSQRIRIAVGINVSIGALLIISCLAIGIRRYRKNKRIQTPVIPRLEHQPYLQQKGELDADGNTVYEKDGMERRHELDPDNEIHEMAAGSVASGPTEMMGEEDYSELEFGVKV